MGYNGSQKGATYVWVVSWYDGRSNSRRKAFRNKQQAMIFMTKLKSDYKNYGIYLDKWFGD